LEHFYSDSCFWLRCQFLRADEICQGCNEIPLYVTMLQEVMVFMFFVPVAPGMTCRAIGNAINGRPWRVIDKDFA